MNELALFIAVAAILLLSQIVINRFEKPMLHYIRMGVSIALLVLVWLFNGDDNIGIKAILSAIALTAIQREYLFVKKTRGN